MATEPAPAEPYSAFADLPCYPLADGHELVYSPLTRRSHALAPLSARLLRGCRPFAPLDEHAARLCGELNLGPQQEAIRRALDELAAAGLLVSRSELISYSQERSRSRGHAGIAALGVPTRDRPDSLRACLISFAVSARQQGRSLDFVVVDDSQTAEACQTNRQVVRKVARGVGATIRYASREERARFARALAQEAGAPPDTVELALLGGPDFPITTGASRNALLLDTVGDLVLQVDDDTSSRIALAPASGDGLTLFSGHDPTEFWFPSPDASLPSPVAGDLPATHERLLGRSVGEALAEARPDEVVLDGAGSSFFRRLEAGAGTILTTMAGVVGDSGMGAPLYFLGLEGPSRARLNRSEAEYRLAITGRQVLRAVTRPTISEGSFCMALNLGLDNRQLLPPFFPVLRNQDGIFGALLRGCFSAFVGFLPQALSHAPPAPRAFSADGLWQRAARLQTSQAIQLLLGACAPPLRPTNPARALRALGASLEELAALPAADFEELLRLNVWSSFARSAAQMEGLVRKYGGAPAWWAEDVRQVVTVFRESLMSRALCLPGDIGAADLDSAVQALQKLVRQFGQLLQAWPALVEAARRLRGRGARLAVAPGDSTP
jgi:hypothetical protein